MRRYTMSMDEEQAHITSKALELYTRVMMGQFGYIAEVAQPLIEERGVATFAEASEAMILVKEAVLGFSTGQSHGIHNPKVHEHARIAFDVHKVIRHRLAWDREPQGGMGVDFDDPDPTAHDKLLPTIHSTHSNETIQIRGVGPFAEPERGS